MNKFKKINFDFIKIKSEADFLRIFHNDEICKAYLEQVIWHGEAESPYDKTSQVYECKNGRYKCKNTGKYFNILTGTIFQNTKIELRLWFWAIYLLTTDKRGVPSVLLAGKLGVTQKTAWHMLQKIRNCMDVENYNKLDGIVEADESYVGGKNKNRHRDKKVEKSQGRSHKDKTPVLGLLQRDAKLTAVVVPNVQIETLTKEVFKYVDKEAQLFTDEWQGYNKVSQVYNHAFVEHQKGQYVKDEVTTNNIECSWHILKRVVSSYILVTRKHLQNYVNEFVFRYNVREKTNEEKLSSLMRGISRVITYKDIANGYC